MMKSISLSARFGCLIAGAALLGTSAPLMAQSSEDIIVTGRYGKVPDNVQSASQTVSYADLDLSTQAGRDILRHRLKLTARYLCDKLGESDSTADIVPPCQQSAVNDAMKRLGTIEQNFAPRGTAWVPGTAWKAPYPDTWNTQYP
jgi:UrcA family protein